MVGRGESKEGAELSHSLRARASLMPVCRRNQAGAASCINTRRSFTFSIINYIWEYFSFLIFVSSHPKKSKKKKYKYKFIYSKIHSIRFAHLTFLTSSQRRQAKPAFSTPPQWAPQLEPIREREPIAPDTSKFFCLANADNFHSLNCLSSSFQLLPAPPPVSIPSFKSSDENNLGEMITIDYTS